MLYAGALAQNFGGAHPRTGAAKNVGLQDAERRSAQIAGGDLADEARDVDAGGTGLDAGGVVAEIAAVGLHRGLVTGQRWRNVRKIAGQGGHVEASCGDVGRGVVGLHGPENGNRGRGVKAKRPLCRGIL